MEESLGQVGVRPCSRRRIKVRRRCRLRLRSRDRSGVAQTTLLSRRSPWLAPVEWQQVVAIRRGIKTLILLSTLTYLLRTSAINTDGNIDDDCDCLVLFPGERLLPLAIDATGSSLFSAGLSSAF